MTIPTRMAAVLAALMLALGVAACGGDDEEDAGTTQAQTTEEATKDVSGTVSTMAIWSGPEQEAFRAVLDGFEKKYPGVKARYDSAGDQLPTVLSTAVEGGKPPDVAIVGQPGLVEQFQAKDALKPIDFIKDTVEQDFGEDWVKVGTVDGKLYGLLFKAANKSTVWFNTQVFEDAGVEPPEDWQGFLDNAQTLTQAGTPAYSLGGADGWTLTDLFENIYLRTAGPEKYDQLAEHEIPWTDESVIKALEEMKKVTGDRQNIAGGTRGALQTEFPTSVSQVFGDPPKAAQVIEGDFVAGVITAETKAKPQQDFDVFAFPSIEGGPENAVVGGGDTAIMFSDSPASRALMEYLATPEAAEIWARRGGFASGNKNLDANVYPDEITRKTAGALGEAETFRFDMSDLAPAEFGATPGKGEWKILQDFLSNGDVQKTAQALERAAKRAYEK
ncbi:MAG TPA: ABC transporter substrate-binding protein [Solirubrobacteraceae bacterium]|jgi:ABC-type glycerol-3-phosphate transport system substrate-binding protein|nr:ABC transporter substrate-binding protein [Solirubrobacteraceae bacterium]